MFLRGVPLPNILQNFIWLLRITISCDYCGALYNCDYYFYYALLPIVNQMFNASNIAKAIQMLNLGMSYTLKWQQLSTEAYSERVGSVVHYVYDSVNCAMLTLN